MLASYRHFREAPGEHYLHTRQVLERLVELYEASGRPAEAAEFRAIAERPLPEEEVGEPPCATLGL